MRTRRVQFTETASGHIKRERAWWLGNRDHQDVFATALERGVQILALLPGAGTPYLRTPVADLRRPYLRKLACHLYDTFDDDTVFIRALWGARREHGPVL